MKLEASPASYFFLRLPILLLDQWPSLKPVTITRLVKSAITARGPSLGRDRERHLWGGPGGLFVAFGDGEVSGGVRGGV